MSLYEANLNLFKASAPQLYGILTEEVPVFDVSLAENDFGNIMMSHGKVTCFLHSVYSIENELQNMFQGIGQDTETIILYGIGSGCSIDFIIENYKEIKSLIIIEPSISIFKHCMKNFDFKRLYSASWKNEVNFTFITNQNEAFVAELTIQQGLRGDKNGVIVHPYIFSGFMDFYQRSNESLLKYLKIYVGSLATVSSQWKLWLINSIRNIKQGGVLPVEHIKTFFKDKVVLIVSAGPSLNKNIEFIKEMKGKLIIFAVGSAIKVLDSKGIIPDFRVAIDANESEMDVVEGIDTQATCLLFSNQLYHGVIPNYKARKVRYILDTDFIGKYIYKKMEIPYIVFKNGPSVANSTVDLACTLGAKQVIFMGQDLSYTEEGLHAKGVLVKAEQDDLEWINKQKQILIKNIYGENVYTAHPLLQMKYVLEKAVSKNSHVRFLNATEGGLHIEGTKNINAVEVIKMLEANQDIVDFEALNHALNDCKEIDEYHKKLTAALDIIKSDLNEILKIQKEVVHYLSLLKDKSDLSQSLKERELLYIDKLMGSLENKPFYSEVIEYELRADLLGIRRKFSAQLASGKMSVEDKEMYLTGMCNKITEHVELCRVLLEEVLE